MIKSHLFACVESYHSDCVENPGILGDTTIIYSPPKLCWSFLSTLEITWESSCLTNVCILWHRSTLYLSMAMISYVNMDPQCILSWPWSCLLSMDLWCILIWKTCFVSIISNGYSYLKDVILVCDCSLFSVPPWFLQS